MDALTKFRDIQAKLAECKTAAEAAARGTDRCAQKALACRQRKLQHALQSVKAKLAQSAAGTLDVARAHWEAGAFGQASALYQLAIDGNPTTKCAADIEPLLRHGESCFYGGRWSEAAADADLLTRNWPQCAAGFFLRGRVHAALAEIQEDQTGRPPAQSPDNRRLQAADHAVRDLQQTLSLLNRDKQHSLDFGDVRVWLQRAQNALFALSRRHCNERTRRSVLTTLPGNLLRYIFTFCTHKDLCRLELVCNEWTSMLLDYRRFLWRLLYQRVRRCDSDECIDTRCPKILFSQRYRPWVSCANCEQRYDPLNNGAGCSENCYHPGIYQKLCPGPHRCSGFCPHTYGWTCCQRPDIMRRVVIPEYFDAVRRKYVEAEVSAHTRKRHYAFPQHLGQNCVNKYDVPCSRGCCKGPHSEEAGHFCVDSRKYDPLVQANIGPLHPACPVCRLTASSPQDRRDDCWQDFLGKYALVRRFIRSGRCKGLSWWEPDKRTRELM